MQRIVSIYMDVYIYILRSIYSWNGSFTLNVLFWENFQENSRIFPGNSGAAAIMRMRQANWGTDKNTNW